MVIFRVVEEEMRTKILSSTITEKAIEQSETKEDNIKNDNKSNVINARYTLSG